MNNNFIGQKRIINNNIETTETVIRWEVLNIQNNQRIKVRFISVNSENRQGIRVAIDYGEGEMIINGHSGKIFELWEDECPREIEIECFSDKGLLSIYNVFEKLDWTGKKNKYSQMDYSGMILEQYGNIYRYKCNNATLSSSFDKLVFEIELL